MILKVLANCLELIREVLEGVDYHKGRRIIRILVIERVKLAKRSSCRRTDFKMRTLKVFLAENFEEGIHINT